MTKMIFLIVFLTFFTKVKSQDSVKLFYISKIILSSRDSILLSQCNEIQYNGAIVDILFFKNAIKVDSLITKVVAFTKWNDSVILDINISQQLYNESDSIVINPTHKFSCKGIRGGLFLEGEGIKVKNIKLKFISNPAGSVVYLVPKIMWERNELLRDKNENALNPYRIANGITPVWSPVQEYVYISLFKYNNQYVTIECSPTNKNPVDSVYADFITK